MTSSHNTEQPIEEESTYHGTSHIDQGEMKLQ